jgi:hypothetical protein
MKKMNKIQMEGLQGGKFGCAIALIGCGLSFATVPTGLGSAFLLMGGASLCIYGIATECKS